MTSRPIRRARSGTGPEGRGREASPNPSAWSRPDRPRARGPRRPGRPRPPPYRDDGRGRPGTRRRSPPSGSSVRRNPSGLPIPQNAATVRPASSDERVDDRPRRRSGRAAHAGPRPTRAARPGARPRRGSPAGRLRRPGRPARGRRPRPAAATRPARGAGPAGRSGPGRTGRGHRAGRCRGRGPAGGAGSRRRGRAARTPAPRPRSGPAPTRSGSWRWGTSGRFSSRTRPSSFIPVGLAVAPAEDRDAEPRGRDTSGRPTRPSASCPSRRASGCRPRRPGPRRGDWPSSPGRTPGSARPRPPRPIAGRADSPDQAEPRTGQSADRHEPTDRRLAHRDRQSAAKAASRRIAPPIHASHRLESSSHPSGETVNRSRPATRPTDDGLHARLHRTSPSRDGPSRHGVRPPSP